MWPNSWFHLENLKETDYLGVLGVHGRIKLKWTLNEEDITVLAGFTRLEIGPVDDCCEHGNESFGSLKSGECLDQLASLEGLCSMELANELY
jgi:hypothetical protein